MRWPHRNSRGSSPGLYCLAKETTADFDAENLNFHLRPHFDTLSMKYRRSTIACRIASVGSVMTVQMALLCAD